MGCEGDPPAPTPAASHPLRPLIYTEQPELSNQAAEVREHRLMRELREGSLSGEGRDDEGKSAQESAARAAFYDADAMGRALLKALVERDPRLWEQVFITPENYAALVRVDLEQARQFVDNIQGESMAVWRQFAPARPSEAADGGLGGLLEFVALELGEGRTLEGSLAKDDEPVAQYWGNKLLLRLRGTDVQFELNMRKILRVQHPQKPEEGPHLAAAAPVQMSRALDIFLQAGLHLKPELLEAREYPYPLAVGNFWRYERSEHRSAERGRGGEPEEGVAEDENIAQQSSLVDAYKEQLGQEADEAPEELEAELRQSKLAATETLLEVTSVDRYGSMRLVTLRRTYNDAALSSHNQYFLLLPRRIYHCSAFCRRHIEDLGKLLVYMDTEVPIYQFPLTLNASWGKGGRARGADAAESAEVFKVGPKWRDVRTPAGAYSNTVLIRGRGPLEAVSKYYRGRGQTRFFAHGHGEVQRILEERVGTDSVKVVEKLVEARITSP